MRFSNPFRKAGRWLRGNTHTHTIQSDGKLTPAQVGEAYGKLNYDFVFLTDHWKRTLPPPARGGPLLIAAEELDFDLRGGNYHVVCLGLQREWPRRKFRSLAELTRLAEREKVLLIMAHPYWCGTPSLRYLNAGPFAGVEVYNTVCDALIGKGYSAVHWDDLLDAGKRVWGIAADDMHTPERRAGAGTLKTIAGGWLMVKAKTCTPKAILQAIRGGDFYATQGPLIKDIGVARRRVRVRCSPVKRINFIANRSEGAVCTAAAGPLCEAEYLIPPGTALMCGSNALTKKGRSRGATRSF